LPHCGQLVAGTKASRSDGHTDAALELRVNRGAVIGIDGDGGGHVAVLLYY
jgi:hypothetical protein